MGLLGVLILIEAARRSITPPSMQSDAVRSSLFVFLFVLPLALMALLAYSQQRWVLMVVVMYGTIALALDLATVVQEIKQERSRPAIIALTLCSGVGSFALLVLSGGIVLTNGQDS
jgi:hypothetical protein